MLEDVADGLPHDVDRAKLAKALAALRDDLPLLHRDENEGLLPLLALRCEPDEALKRIIERMRREHGIDSGFADEIVEALEPVAAGAPAENPERLGYMLRGFFENYRRHIAWDGDIILPAANERLTRGDLLELENKMRVHRADRELSARFRRARREVAAGDN